MSKNNSKSTLRHWKQNRQSVSPLRNLQQFTSTADNLIPEADSKLEKRSLSRSKNKTQLNSTLKLHGEGGVIPPIVHISSIHHHISPSGLFEKRLAKISKVYASTKQGPMSVDIKPIGRVTKRNRELAISIDTTNQIASPIAAQCEEVVQQHQASEDDAVRQSDSL